MKPTLRLKPATHLLTVLGMALCVLLPLYAFDQGRALRPTRVLGPLGLPGQADPALADAPQAASSGPLATAEARPSRAQGSGAASGPQTAPQAGASGDAGAPARTIALQALEGPEHLKPFFEAIDRPDRQGPVRVLHYGDSTLAGDGIAKTVRTRLKAQFGDGGPGFFVAGMDTRWMRRDDVRVSRRGDWQVLTILNGGNQGRYGLGGIVAKPPALGELTVSPARSGQSLGQRLEIYTDKTVRTDALQLRINGTAAAVRRTEHPSFDQWTIDHASDISSAELSVGQAGLDIYGLVLEAGAGITWETTAVVGISNGSFRQFNPAHLAEQTRSRRPDLIVLMIGGNDAINEGMFSGDGRAYRAGFTRALQVLREGAAQTACLIMSPLDQGALSDDGRIYSRPTLARMVELQRQVSREQGCAFWDSWAFMGGENSFARWLDQGLAWTDLIHLTERGLHRIGQGLTQALLQAYEQHRSGR